MPDETRNVDGQTPDGSDDSDIRRSVLAAVHRSSKRLEPQDAVLVIVLVVCIGAIALFATDGYRQNQIDVFGSDPISLTYFLVVVIVVLFAIVVVTFFVYRAVSKMTSNSKQLTSDLNDLKILTERRLTKLEEQTSRVYKAFVPINREFDTVKELVSRVVQNEVSDVEKAKAFLQSEKPKAALELLTVANEATPGRPDILRNLSYAYSDLGEIDNAIRCMEDAIDASIASGQDTESVVSQSYFHLARYLEFKYKDKNDEAILKRAMEAFEKITDEDWMRKANVTPDLSKTRKAVYRG